MKNSAYGKNFRRGFALIQLLMALAIVSIIAVPMMNSYVSSWQQMLAADKRSQARMLARWKLQEQMSIPFSKVQAQDPGSCSLPDEVPDTEGFRCKVTRSSVTGNPGAMRIDVTILYDSMQSGGQRSIFCTSQQLEDSNCPDLSSYRADREL
jgi:Tfp pilus assembly protein PilE